MTGPRLLLVDDNPEDRILALRDIRREFPGAQAVEVTDPAEFDRALASGPFDVVITDYQLHWSTGIRVLEQVHARWPDVPVIMYTGSGTEEVAAAATRAGLHDYVVKSPRHRMRLTTAVASAVASVEHRRALRAARDLYRVLFEQSLAGVYVGHEGLIQDCNPALARMFGFESPEAMRGLRAADLLAEPPGWVQAQRERVLAGDELQNVEATGRRRDGSEFPLLLAARSHVEAGRTVIIATVLDVTAQARTREDLHRAAVEWRTTFDGISSPILVARRDGTIVRLNRAAAALAGDDLKHMLGRRLAELPALEPWRAAAELVTAVATHEGPVTSTVRDPASGFTWEIAAFPTGRPEEADRVISLIFRDITEVVELQETLVRNQTMSALGQLIAGVAHEVRSPLFGISATLDAFEARFGDRAEFRSYLENLRRELSRMNDLMRDLLELGKPATTARRPEPLGAVLDDALQAIRAEAEHRRVGVRNQVTGAEGAVLVLADRRRLAQVFENLIKNAVQHAPSGSDVVVAAHRQDSPPGDEIVLTVEDRGPGFRPEDLPRVFEPFFTRRTGGTGLGLAIVLRIVEDHGGTVTAANRRGGGASIRVVLPLLGPAAEAAA